MSVMQINISFQLLDIKMTKLNSKYLKSSPDNKVVYLSGASFNSIAKSRSEIQKLKNLINKNNKVIIFKNVVEKNIIKTIEKNRNRILKSKPFFFKTYLGSDDLYIFNKENKKSHVKGYFKKIELYPWNKKNKLLTKDDVYRIYEAAGFSNARNLITINNLELYQTAFVHSSAATCGSPFSFIVAKVAVVAPGISSILQP